MKNKYGSILLGVIVISATGCGEEDACASALFPNMPEGAIGAVYVAAACPAEGADGSKVRPFSTIGDGISAAATGAAVLVAPGTYAETLMIDKGISLVGSSSPEDAESAAVTLKPPESKGIVVKSVDDVRIRGVVVQEAKEIGIQVEGESVTVEGSRIENTRAGDGKPPPFGFGVTAYNNGSIILQHSAVTGSASDAVVAINARAIILQNVISDNGGKGIVVGNAQEEARVEGNTLSNNTDIGVWVAGSKAIILQNTIKGSIIGGGNMGYGVFVGAPAQEPDTLADVTMQDNVVEGNDRIGVLLSRGAKTIILQKNKINNNGVGVTTRAMAGIWIQSDACADKDGSTIDGNELSGNRFVGIGLTGNTNAIILQNNAVTGTVMEEAKMGIDNKTITMGDGFGVFKGASARIMGNTVSKNARFGLILDDALGASTTISGNTFSDHEQYAIILQNQPNAPDTSTNTYQGNQAGDINVAPQGTFTIWDEEMGTP